MSLGKNGSVLTVYSIDVEPVVVEVCGKVSSEIELCVMLVCHDCKIGCAMAESANGRIHTPLMYPA